MLSAKLIRLFLGMRTNDLLPQADLLLEMLDAQDTFDLTHNLLTFNTDINGISSRTASFSQSLTNAVNRPNVTLTPPAMERHAHFKERSFDDSKVSTDEESNGRPLCLRLADMSSILSNED